MLSADSKLRGRNRSDGVCFSRELWLVAFKRGTANVSNSCLRLLSCMASPDKAITWERMGSSYPSRMGRSTPRPSAKNHNGGAGVPTGRIRRSSRAASRGSRMSQRGVAALQQKKGQCSYSAVNQVSHEGRKQRGSCIGTPVADTRKHKRQEGHASEIPPNQTKQPSPRHTEAETRSLISKQQPVTHANQGADEQMDQKTTENGKAAAQSRNFRQYSGGKHHRTGDQAAYEAGQRSPLKRTNEANATPFPSPLERAALNEQPNPRAVQGGVSDAQDQPIEDMPHQCTAQLTPVFRRPAYRDS